MIPRMPPCRVPVPVPASIEIKKKTEIYKKRQFEFYFTFCRKKYKVYFIHFIAILYANEKIFLCGWLGGTQFFYSVVKKLFPNKTVEWTKPRVTSHQFSLNKSPHKKLRSIFVGLIPFVLFLRSFLVGKILFCKYLQIGKGQDGLMTSQINAFVFFFQM